MCSACPYRYFWLSLLDVTNFFRLLNYVLPAPVCHWCGTWKGDKICSSCKKARYCSEKHQVLYVEFTLIDWFLTWAHILDKRPLIVVCQALHWRTGHKNDCLQLISSSDSSKSVLPAIGKGDYAWITTPIYALNIWIVIFWPFISIYLQFLLALPGQNLR